MSKRRNIREAAIQFLYLADLENGPEASNMQEAFWQMIQESSLKKFNLAKTKAILHVTQGRDDRLNKLNELATDAQAQLATGSTTQPLVAALKRLISQEKNLSKEIEALTLVVQNKKTEAVPDQLIRAVIDANEALIQIRSAWNEQLSSLPDCKMNMEALNASISHLERASQRLASMEDPNASMHAFAHLHSSGAELESFRQETQKLVSRILSHKEEIDHMLAGVIENYTPQRVDPVDRAILRLAAFELKISDDIPRAVAINEAIEIAKKYGTNDSARFINGVLDAL